MIRFGVAALIWLRVTFALSVGPEFYRVVFEPSMQNSTIVLTITSDTNQKPYYKWQYWHIDPDMDNLNIPREKLPPGGYRIIATLFQFDSDGKEVPTEWADAVILVR